MISLSKCAPPVFHNSFPTNFQVNEFWSSPFSERELNTAISSLKIKSSLGLDKIDNNIISHFPDEARSALLKIYNDLMSSSSFPVSWNNFLVFFIPKSTPNIYRPISLASCLFELMEKLVYSRLGWYLEHNFHLSPSQFGFRRSRSCADNVAVLYKVVWTGFAHRDITDRADKPA